MIIFLKSLQSILRSTRISHIFQACEECKLISKRLYDKPNNIEDLSEMREWMKTVPEQLIHHIDVIDHATVDYELIEEFNYNLTQDDFVTK